MTLEGAIKYCNEAVEEKLEEIQDCLEVNDMESAMECKKCIEDYKQLSNWLRQLQKIQIIIEEYRNVPIEVMDSDDAFTKICDVVEEKKQVDKGENL